PHPDPGAVRGRRRGRGRHDARDRRHLPHAGPRARATRSSGGTTRGDDMSAATHASTHVVEPAETPLTPESWGKLGMWIFLAGDAVGFGVLLSGYGIMRASSADWPNP